MSILKVSAYTYRRFNDIVVKDPEQNMPPLFTEGPEQNMPPLFTEADPWITLLTRAPLGSGWSHILLEGVGGRIGPPSVISQTTGPIFKIQTPFDSPVHELSKHGVKFDLEVTDDITGQVKVRMLDFSGFVTSASTTSMLSANKVNESAWIVSLTSVSITSCAL